MGAEEDAQGVPRRHFGQYWAEFGENHKNSKEMASHPFYGLKHGLGATSGLKKLMGESQKLEGNGLWRPNWAKHGASSSAFGLQRASGDLDDVIWVISIIFHCSCHIAAQQVLPFAHGTIWLWNGIRCLRRTHHAPCGASQGFFSASFKDARVVLLLLHEIMKT